MKALRTMLLALLLCRQPGRGQTQDEEEDNVDSGLDDYDDEDEDDEEAEEDSRGRGAHPPAPALLRCYSCPSLRRGESCNQTQSCSPSQAFCKALVSDGQTESGPLTTYSAWCADTCQPITKMAEETLMTVTCCQSTLCNIPPWQDRQGSGAGSPQGSPTTGATILLLSLLTSLQVMRS
ncbi:glycosylphosphatidylinositol-anchored high density lipoprotein-binding protein 1 isoform X2 [Manis javanica]|uniref:glycosylphosphatidylinositol-anchored high density lipoprotein-binding protein 1 isoform X2 n=1 Tax=Manis javanica TaxID=9974 RepID=UPI00187A7CD1|nr:glycosylphosphatidylinositol-anchored high density lipoprotein-binding protein 1 isoform X1 [Manis javanica]XP_036879055.1 glycosylphosphatidylinositol-anchored high density lipoprotein-binding protein 1 isoform X1 [Manis javanica]